MAVRFAVLLGALAFLGVAAASYAAAAETTTSADIGQSQFDQCVGTAPVGLNPPSCVFDANGNLISRSPSDPGATGTSLNIVPFIFLVLIWSAVPFLIAVSIARSRDEPISTAVLLTLVLGWVGLLIVVYGQRRAADDVGRLVRPAPSAYSPPRPPAPPPSAVGAEVRQRLATIDELYAQGVITGAERDSRRAAIVDQL